MPSQTGTQTSRPKRWEPKIGERVAEHRLGAHVTISTVDKITATQIVLNNGHRYRRAQLTEIGRYGDRDLLPLDHTSVIRQRGEDGLSRVVGEIDRARRGQRGSVDPCDILRAAAANAVNALADIVDTAPVSPGRATTLPANSVVATASLVAMKLPDEDVVDLPWFVTGAGTTRWSNDDVDRMLTDGTATVLRVG